jgi:paraquat-inducible protein A
MCGYAHRLPRLRPGESAQCVRCDTMLAHGSRFGGDAAIAFTLTGVLLAVPATLLPFVEVSKFQAARSSYAFSGVRALWNDGMPFLGVWVFLCGMVVPFLLLGTLAGLLLPVRLGWRARPPRWLLRVARAFEQWAMPEVQVLAILVAFAKLGSLVNVHVGPGLWCYSGMALCVLIAWRGFELCHAPHLLTPEPGAPAPAA